MLGDRSVKHKPDVPHGALKWLKHLSFNASLNISTPYRMNRIVNMIGRWSDLITLNIRCWCEGCSKTVLNFAEAGECEVILNYNSIGPVGVGSLAKGLLT